MTRIRNNVSYTRIKRQVKRSRRGQASAIGAVLFLALLVLMVAFVQEVYLTQVNMNQVDTERIQENITITSAYINSDGHLVFNVANRGSNTANLARLWIINQTDNQHFHFPFSNYYVEPGATISNVTSVVLTLGQNYAIRVVTERGNIASYNLVPSLRARIQIISPSYNASLLMGSNVTVTLCITNNDTSDSNIYNLQPVLSVDPAPSLSLVSGPSPDKVELLPPGDSAFFSYVYNVTGYGLTPLLNGSYLGSRVINLNGSFVGAPEGNFNLTNVYVSILDIANQASVGSLQLFAESFSYIINDGNKYPLGDPAQNGWYVGAPSNPGQGYPAYTTVPNAWVIFSLIVQNVDPVGRTIYLNSLSNIYLSGSFGDKVFYIINDANNVPSAYSDQTQIALNPGQTKRLYFGSSTPTDFKSIGTPAQGNPATVFFLANGHFDDGTPFSKNWPFVSTYTSVATVTSMSSTSGATDQTINISFSGFSYNTNLYWFDSTYGVSFTVNLIGSGSTTDATFTVPESAPGYFAVYVSDGVNVAYVTFYHT